MAWWESLDKYFDQGYNESMKWYKHKNFWYVVLGGIVFIIYILFWR